MSKRVFGSQVAHNFVGQGGYRCQHVPPALEDQNIRKMFFRWPELEVVGHLAHLAVLLARSVSFGVVVRFASLTRMTSSSRKRMSQVRLSLGVFMSLRRFNSYSFSPSGCSHRSRREAIVRIFSFKRSAKRTFQPCSRWTCHTAIPREQLQWLLPRFEFYFNLRFLI